MRCKGCHYSLANRGGLEHRCPECGRRFDPNDRSTFLATVSSRPRRPLQHWILVAPSILCGFAAIWMWSTIIIFQESKGDMFGGLPVSIILGAVNAFIEWPRTLLASFIFYVVFLIIWLARRLFQRL